MLRKLSLAVLFAACAVTQGRLQAGAVFRSKNADVMKADEIMEAELERERLLAGHISLSFGYGDEDKKNEEDEPGIPSIPAPEEPAPAPTPEVTPPTPAEPAPTPAEPAPTPAEPAPTPAEPAPTPAEPAPTPAEPAPEPTEPAPEPTAPEPTAPVPPPTPPTPGGLTLSSSAFAPGGAIPVVHTCDIPSGTGESPPMTFENIPEGTVTWALTAEDVTTPWTHWVLFNVGSAATGLPQNVPPQPGFSDGSVQGTNSFGNFGYGGMCPPEGDFTEHSYIFRLYALSDSLSGLSSATTKDELEAAISDSGLLIEMSELGAIYQREEE